MDISPASELNTAVGQSQIVEYSELNLARPLFIIKSVAMLFAVEVDEAQRQARLFEYSELNSAMALTWTKVPAQPVEIDVTIGGSRPVGIFGPISGTEFEEEFDARARFSREFSTDIDAGLKVVPAVTQFEASVTGNTRFTRNVEFGYPGTRMVALHYSQVLREDREILELIDLGIL